MSPLPKSVWCEVSIDFKHVKPNEYLLVIMDDMSRYPVVELHLSIMCYQYLIVYSQCERFMRTLSKTIKSSIIERHSYQQQVHVFLRNYRATPHPSTGVPPATLMFNRPMKVRLPQKEHLSVNNDSVKERDELKNNHNKSYTDSKHKFTISIRFIMIIFQFTVFHIIVKDCKLKIGDNVFVKNKNKGVFDSYYTDNKFIVTNVNESMISAECNGHKITRNITFFNKVNNELECEDDDFDLSIFLK